MSESYWANDYQAWLLAHYYAIAPIDPLKYERLLPTDGIGSYFFANVSNTVKVIVQYDCTKLEHPE